MTESKLPRRLTLPPAALQAESRVPLDILPDLPALCAHFARSIAGEIAANNLAGKPTRN